MFWKSILDYLLKTVSNCQFPRLKEDGTKPPLTINLLSEARASMYYCILLFHSDIFTITVPKLSLTIFCHCALFTKKVKRSYECYSFWVPTGES